MIWILVALCLGWGCNCCGIRRRRHYSDLLPAFLILIIVLRFAGHVPWIPILACVAIGYFLRKIEETRGEDWFGEVSDEEMEEGLKDD